MLSSSILSLLALAGLASAHGYCKQVKIDGKLYPGSVGGNANPSQSPIRPIDNGSDNGAPIDDVSSPNMRCGINAKPAAQVASAKPGSQVEVFWQAPTGGNWFHAAGPIISYMAKCDGDCTTFEPSSSTEWFKISELGEKKAGDPSSWYQADLNSGAPATITLPSELSGGNYLLRQEIVATQNSQTKGATEFYPTCMQLKVDGPSNGPVPSPTVHFPGAYSPDDQGIFGNFYNPGVNYVFPGGALSNIAGGSSSSSSKPSSSGSSDSSDSSGSSTTPPVPVNVAPKPADSSDSSSATKPKTTTSGSGSCKRKRSLAKRSHSAHKKRRMSSN